jgi:hypothetical protein
MRQGLKRSLIRCGGLLAVLLLACVGVVSYVFTGSSRPGELVKFHPAQLTIRAGHPLYFALRGGLFFDRDGMIAPASTPIWTGRIDGAWVSPDSAHLLVLSGTALHLLTPEGGQRNTFTPAGELFLYPEKGERPYWDASSIQWTPDSRAFFILRRWTNAVGPVALYRYRLGDSTPQELLAIAHPPRRFLPSDSLTFSASGQSVYYALIETDSNYALYRFDIPTAAVTVLRDVTGGPQPPVPPPVDAGAVFANFPRRVLSGNGVGLAWTRSLDLTSHLLLVWQSAGERCAVVRRVGDQLSALIRARKGVSPKSGPYCPISLAESYYLPGNRYALVRVRTAQHDGYLVGDVHDGQYAMAPSGLEVFFALHSRNVTGATQRYDGPHLVSGFDETTMLPRIRVMAP